MSATSLPLDPKRGRSPLTRKKLSAFQQLLQEETKHSRLSPLQQSELTERLNQSIYLLENDALILGIHDVCLEHLDHPDVSGKQPATKKKPAVSFSETDVRELFQKLTPVTQHCVHACIRSAKLIEEKREEPALSLPLAPELTGCFSLLLRDAYLFGKKTIQQFNHSSQ